MNAIEITITDPDLIAKLAAADGRIVFRGPGGDQVMTVQTVGRMVPPPGVKSPVSDEDFEQARKASSSGITLAEFWKKVERGEWK